MPWPQKILSILLTNYATIILKERGNMHPRSTSNQPELSSEPAKAFAAIQGGSYVKMLARLFELATGISNISSRLPHVHVNDSIRLDSQLAAINQELKKDYTGTLLKSSEEISSHISQLKQIRTTASAGGMFEQQYQPLKETLNKHIQAYAGLIDRVNNCIKESNVKDLLIRYDQKKISLTDLKKELENLKVKYTELFDDVRNLLDNKNTLQQNLDQLKHETSARLAPAIGEKPIGPAPTPE